MNSIQKHYIREYKVLMCGLTILLSAVFSLVAVVDNADKFFTQGLNFFQLIWLLLLKMPEIIKYILPLSSLVSLMFVLGKAQRRNELIIITISGQNIRKFLMPFLYISLLLVFLSFFFSEVVDPLARAQLNRLIYTDQKNVLYQKGGVWLRAPGSIIAHAEIVEPEKGIIRGVMVYYLKDGLLSKVIRAEEGTWRDESWEILKALVYDIKRKRLYKEDKLYLEKIGKREYLSQGKSKIEEMSVFSLLKYNRALLSMGIKNRKLLVDTYSRISYPFTVLFTTFVGMYLIFRYRRLSGSLSVGLAVGVSLAYWFFFSFSLSVGYSGILPPWVAGCIVPFLANIIGIKLFLSIPT